MDDVTWLLLAFMTLIVDGRDGGFGMFPCVFAMNWFFDALPPCHFQSDHLDLW
jgi:hypothetical protein